MKRKEITMTHILNKIQSVLLQDCSVRLNFKNRDVNLATVSLITRI